MEKITIILGALVCGILILSLLIIWTKKDIKQAQQKTQVDLDWLESEKLKPKAAIHFLLTDQTILCTRPFEPGLVMLGSNWNMKQSSEELARKQLVKSFEAGYFEDQDENFYPTAQILKAWIELA